MTWIIDHQQHIHSELSEYETLKKATLAVHVSVDGYEKKPLVDIKETKTKLICTCPQTLLSKTYMVIIYISV